jgi:hypothetical protein
MSRVPQDSPETFCLNLLIRPSSQNIQNNSSLDHGYNHKILGCFDFIYSEDYLRIKLQSQDPLQPLRHELDLTTRSRSRDPCPSVGVLTLPPFPFEAFIQDLDHVEALSSMHHLKVLQIHC